MPEKINISYDDIAAMQIEAAIDQFNRGSLQGFVCSITLAHAGGDILKTLIPKESNALNIVKEALSRKSEWTKDQIGNVLRSVPNGLKHFRENMTEGEFDPRLFAFVTISMAVSNYSIFKKGMTEKMHEFHQKWINKDAMQ